jgi:hypothetical protein
MEGSHREQDQGYRRHDNRASQSPGRRRHADEPEMRVSRRRSKSPQKQKRLSACSLFLCRWSARS